MMVSSSASALLRFAGWTYLPDTIASTALTFIHRAYTSISGRPSPQKGTPSYHRNYRYVFATVVLGYLAYNMIEASRLMPANFYELLGVHPDANENQLKAGFRTFARRNHPDKVGPEGETLFIQVRDAYDALKNPVTRFAYDRFGPDALNWTKCTTVLDYLHQGLTQSVGFHVVSGAVLLTYSAMGAKSSASFWRYVFFFALMASELALILGPSTSMNTSASLSSTATGAADSSATMQENLLTYLFPRRVAYQHILFLHQLFMFLSVAVSRVAPVLFPPTVDEIDGIGIDLTTLENVLNKMDMIGGSMNAEVYHMLQAQVHALHAGPMTDDDGVRFGAMRAFTNEKIDPQVQESLVSGMTAVAVEGRLRQAADAPGPLKSVWDSAVARVRNAVGMRGRPMPLRKVSRRTEWWERRRPSEMQVQRVDVDLTGESDEPKLPSPISASNSEMGIGNGNKFGLTLPNLPSPQATPPHMHTPSMLRRESYLRGRSRSC